MGRLIDFILDLGQNLLSGDEEARAQLLQLDVPQALWAIDAKFDLLADYLEHGLSIVPQRPGEKKPCVRWKPYQTTRPSAADIFYWFRRWRDAGPAAVLGPVSGIVALDIDGREAHEELVRRLGRVPVAPTVLSGSGEKYRYHKFFQCPAIQMKAKSTPWNPKLEFRGQGGIIILPPALHKSGRRYRWVRGKSLNDIPLPPLPEPVVAALRERKPPNSMHIAIAHQKEQSVSLVPGICRKTCDFLRGKFADPPGWNSRLFAAACDMEGNGLPLERALPLLIAGAQPWDAEEEARAISTIESAYSQPRVPARLLNKENQNSHRTR